MAPLARLTLASLTIVDSLINVASVSAFSPGSTTASNTHSPFLSRAPLSPYHSSNINHMPDLKKRGGATTNEPNSPSTTAISASATTADPAAKKKKLRISAFDSMRFFLITCIVLGHFIKFANPSDFLFKFFSQHNVIVGAFFALSGYVTAYTTTENGQKEASPRLTETPAQAWTLSRVFGFYPLHLLVLVLFSPMFVYADVTYNGWLKTAWHGFLSVTLTQAWFPMHAEVWNAPTWFLSGLVFATGLMPFALPKIAKMDKKALRRSAFWLTLVSVLPKLGYFYDFNCLNVPEGWTSPKAHPNLAIFNMMRFNPVLIAAEVLIGAVACRLVMLDGSSNDEAQPVKTNALSTVVPLLGILGCMLARAAGVVEVSDMLVRPLIFIPLFLRLLMSAHRNTVRPDVKDPTVDLLSSKPLVWLGNLSFPIYIVHGPLGQVFYKKLIAKKLWGQVLAGPAYFGVYLASVMALAWILQNTFMTNKSVGAWSKKTANNLASWM